MHSLFYTSAFYIFPPIAQTKDYRYVLSTNYQKSEEKTAGQERRFFALLFTGGLLKRISVARTHKLPEYRYTRKVRSGADATRLGRARLTSPRREPDLSLAGCLIHLFLQFPLG